MTHLPQVAAYADVHLVVDSSAGKGKSSEVRRLSEDDRVGELARMLGGARRVGQRAGAREGTARRGAEGSGAVGIRDRIVDAIVLRM